jgi:AraC family transcriptional regulator of adaptative response / DNA-3-methyladenine glycosylase II
VTQTDLQLPADYELEFLIRFLEGRAVPGLEEVDGTTIRRAVRGGCVFDMDNPALILALKFIPLRKDEDGGRVHITSTVEVKPRELRRLAERLLGLGPELEPFLRKAKRDPLLRHSVALRPGLRVPQFIDPFEATIRAILGQQVSVAGARTMAGRLVAAFGAPIEGDSLRTFPEPEVMAEAGPTRLATIGLTGAKSRALHSLAEAVAKGLVDWRRLRELPAADAEAALVSLPGIGPWTASYVRMRALGDLDAFPASDLGVLKAMGGTPGSPLADVKAARERAERWRPYRALAVLHLWNAPAASQRRGPLGTRTTLET